MTTEWEQRKQISADRKQEGREAGRRKAGVMGAALAGMMLSIHEIYDGPLPEQLLIVADADGDPGDVDADGIDFQVEENQVQSNPPNTAD